MAELTPGSPVSVRYTKWGGRRHHGGEVVYLGADEHGSWLGDPVGNGWSGGPREFVSVTNNVLLIPPERWCTAMFYEPHPTLQFRVYCDITTPAQWTGDRVTAVDLDLDVIRSIDDDVYVDDEDEFAEHQVSYGYPPDIIAAAEREATRVADELRSGAVHFAEPLIDHWRAVFDGLRTDR